MPWAGVASFMALHSGWPFASIGSAALGSGPTRSSDVRPFGDSSGLRNVAHYGSARGRVEFVEGPGMTITIFDPRTGRPVTITVPERPFPRPSSAT
jgi:hypothetical protein